MKTFAAAVALIALCVATPSQAARDPSAQAEASQGTVAVMADASRLGATQLTTLAPAPGAWTSPGSPSEFDFDSLAGQVDGGTLLIALGTLALVLARPVSRALHRQAQHRRAIALASTLGHPPRG